MMMMIGSSSTNRKILSTVRFFPDVVKNFSTQFGGEEFLAFSPPASLTVKNELRPLEHACSKADTSSNEGRGFDSR